MRRRVVMVITLGLLLSIRAVVPGSEFCPMKTPTPWCGMSQDDSMDGLPSSVVTVHPDEAILDESRSGCSLIHAPLVSAENHHMSLFSSAPPVPPPRRLG